MAKQELSMHTSYLVITWIWEKNKNVALENAYPLEEAPPNYMNLNINFPHLFPPI